MNWKQTEKALHDRLATMSVPEEVTGNGTSYLWLSDADIIKRNIEGNPPPSWSDLCELKMMEALAEEDPEELRERVLDLSAFALIWAQNI